RAAALTRDVARPDLLLIAALLHDIGKGWPGDHRVTGEVVTRQITRRMGLAAEDTELVARAVRHHLLLPHMATRRDLDDPQTAAQVAAAVGGRPLLELLHALAIADGRATGPAAWNDWKAGLVAGLVRRVEAVLGGGPPPVPRPLRPGQAALAAAGPPAALGTGSQGAVVSPDRRGPPGPAGGAGGGGGGPPRPPARGAPGQRTHAGRDGGALVPRRPPLGGTAGCRAGPLGSARGAGWCPGRGGAAETAGAAPPAA